MISNQVIKQLSTLPIIDFKDPKAALKLREACEKIGFFYIKNHGVSDNLISRVFAESKNFFLLPTKEKEQYEATTKTGMRGYCKMESENLEPENKTRGDTKEGFYFGAHFETGSYENKTFPMHVPNVLPDQSQCSRNISNFQPVLKEYHQEMSKLAKRTLQLMAEGLNLDKHYFDSKQTRPVALVRLLHYSEEKSDPSTQALGCGAHSDYGALTLLKTDENEGLQVLQKNGQWLDVPPIQDAFIVNIGDLMARWTNDVFQSTIHRVVNKSGKERYSIPFFYDLDFDAHIECLEQFKSESNPPKYPPITAGQHVMDMYSKTYTKFDHESIKQTTQQQ